ncbi:MAG: alpha-galactosidase [Candidatus Sumerlaeota bacterium]|nr:alpha-galactosidase [Candidatus Sumerlaeota bacterium]
MAKVVIIGAGSRNFCKRLCHDIVSFPEMSDWRLTLVDIDRERLGYMHAIIRRVVEAVGAKAQVESTINRRKALDGADYVITTFRAGAGDVEWYDSQLAFKKHGVRQTVTDTCSLGAVFRVCRTIPILEAIAKDVEELCPEAQWLNYTNPMAMNVWATYLVSPVKIIGLCHSVQGTSKRLADYIGAPYEEISFKTAGINHMAWFLEFKRNGRDAYPQLREAMRRPSVFKRDPVRFEILRHFGCFVTESSGHMAEYVPYFLNHDDLVEKYGLRVRTPERMRQFAKGLRRKYELVKAEATGELEIPLERSHEYGAYIIQSLHTGVERCVYGTVRNTGLITNLPEGCAVEVPCLVNKNGLQPCHVGELPPQLAALNRQCVSVQELAVRGVVERNRDHLCQALMMDPNTSWRVKLADVRKLVDKRLSYNKEYYPKGL